VEYLAECGVQFPQGCDIRRGPVPDAAAAAARVDRNACRHEGGERADEAARRSNVRDPGQRLLAL
jgi:hypothetical protein